MYVERQYKKVLQLTHAHLRHPFYVQQLTFYETIKQKHQFLFDNNHKNNPSTTLPEMNNNISCSKDSSILITTNSKTLFIYNEPYNLQKRLNCLYYSTHTLNCLALPSLNVPGTTSSSN